MYKRQIVITEIPYGVNKEQLVMAIADLAKEGKVDGIANVNDEDVYKRQILNTALVLSAFKVLGPAMAVTARPRTK